MAVYNGSPLPFNLYEAGRQDGYETGKRETTNNIVNKLMNYDEFLLHADENGYLLYVDFAAWLDEIAKQFGVDVKENNYAI